MDPTKPPTKKKRLVIRRPPLENVKPILFRPETIPLDFQKWRIQMVYVLVDLRDFQRPLI